MLFWVNNRNQDREINLIYNDFLAVNIHRIKMIKIESRIFRFRIFYHNL